VREIAKGAAITLVAAMLSIAGWMLVFIHFAVVPDGTPYPDGWSTLTSAEQVEWLRTHTVVLSGFEGSVYMLKHFSKYSAQFAAMFSMTWIAAVLAVGMWWHLTRMELEETEDESTNSERFRRPAEGKEQ
jgi:hypothetical protein